MSRIEDQVMGSIAVIHAGRALVSATALKLYALAVSVWTFGALVWVARVEQNFLNVAHGGALAVGNYVLYALLHARLPVQLTLLVAALALGSLALDALRASEPARRFA